MAKAITSMTKAIPSMAKAIMSMAKVTTPSIAEAIVSIINRTYTLFANPIVQIKTAHNADPFTIPAWFVQVVNGKDERAGPPLQPFPSPPP